MKTITEIDENGNTVFKIISSISARIVEDQERVIMETINQALDHTEYTISKKKLIDLLVRDNDYEVPIEAWLDTKCKCGHVFSKDLGDGYHKIPIENKTKFCPDCGQRLKWRDKL